MYVNFKHAKPAVPESDVTVWSPSMSKAKIIEMTEARHLRGVIDDVEQIAERNARVRKALAEKDSGRPGHYYGKDIVLEGSIPMAAFVVAAQEFDGDPEWWRDDAKFQKYMQNHPEWNWLNG